MNVGELKKIEIQRVGNCRLIGVYDANFYYHTSYELDAQYHEDDGELDHIVMVGDKGEHALRVDLDRKRIVEHWKGFLANNGEELPEKIPAIKRKFKKRYYIDFYGNKRPVSYYKFRR